MEKGQHAPTKFCISCESELPAIARFCWWCGLKQEEIVVNGERADPENILLKRLMRFLDEALVHYGWERKRQDYIERFLRKDFFNISSYRLEMIDRSINPAWTMGGGRLVAPHVDLELHKILDLFFAKFSFDLNDWIFPEKILAYHDADIPRTGRQQFYLDLLDLDLHPSNFITDFINIAPRVLKPAWESYLKPDQGEVIRLVIALDTDRFGYGLGLSDTTLFWRMPFNSSKRIEIDQIKQVDRKNDALLINGAYLNMGRPLNQKLYKMLLLMLNY